MAKGSLPAVAHGPSPRRPRDTKHAKMGLLLSRVERATGERNPADALITFANHLSGAAQRGSHRKSTPGLTVGPNFDCRPHSTPRLGRESSPTGSQQLSARSARSSPSRNSQFQGRGSSLGSSLGGSSPLNCLTSQPCWTPQPGSTTRKRLTDGLRSARLYVRCVPSVRAYNSPVDPQKELEEDANSDEESCFTSESVESEEAGDGVCRRVSRTSGNSRVSGEQEHSAEAADSDTVEIPWTEVELRNVFKKFGDEHEREVQTEDLQSLLRYLGARRSDEEVQRLIREQTTYASLDWFEFVEFIKRFRDYDMKDLREQFNAADVDGSGELDMKELHIVMTKGGFSPTKEATEEALEEIDVDSNGLINFVEFEQLREHLRVNRGFLKAEACELRMLYNRVAKMDQTKLPVEELHRISSYIGYHVSQQEITDITVEVDKDRSGSINFDELLEIIRGIRENEGKKIYKIIAEQDHSFVYTDGRRSSAEMRLCGKARGAMRRKTLLGPAALFNRGGADSMKPSVSFPPERSANALPITDLRAVLSSLGYFVSSEIMNEILEAKCKDREQREKLTADEIQTFLRCYRRVEGFTKSEVEFLKLCFDREQSVSVAGDDDQSLDALELGRVLRGFGISKSLQQVQRLIDDIDFDGSGQLDFEEFTKLMRQLFYEEALQRRQIFSKLEFSHDDKMPIEHLEQAMALINGTEPDQEMIRIALSNSIAIYAIPRDLTVSDFDQFFAAYRKLLMDSVRMNAGFIPSEVEMLRGVFLSYPQEDGLLDSTSMRQVISELFPEAVESPEGRQKVMAAVGELMPTEAGLDFLGFLRMMRKCHDLRDEQDIVREAEVVRTCEYSTEEVEGLRQLFSSNINCFGEITLEGLVKVFQRITTVNAQEAQELAAFLKDASSQRRECVRFPDFLQLMRTIVQQNVIGINDAATRALRRKAVSKAGRKESIRNAVVEKRRRAVGGYQPEIEKAHTDALLAPRVAVIEPPSISKVKSVPA